MTKQQNWTIQEDQMLVRLHADAGCFQRWKFISAKLKEKGILKTQFQCRDRFINHLDPDLKLGKLSKWEIVKLFECYDEYGPRWSFFETKIKGRSQNMLKNQFYSTLRSLLRLLIKVGHKKNLYVWKIESINYSSKLLADLYQGRKSFYRHKNFFKSCLKNIGCCVEKQFLQNYLSTIDGQQLKSFYQVIYEQIGKKQSGQQSQGNHPIQKNEGIERQKFPINNITKQQISKQKQDKGLKNGLCQKTEKGHSLQIKRSQKYGQWTQQNGNRDSKYSSNNNMGMNFSEMQKSIQEWGQKYEQIVIMPIDMHQNLYPIEAQYNMYYYYPYNC